MVDLRWEGKYHDDTRIRPGRTILGLDTVEAFAAAAADAGSAPWCNRLIWGDKRHVLPTLLPEVGGQVQLIYIDPPFTSGVGYARTVALPGRPGSATARVPTYEQPAYGDRWARGLDAYLQWFSETAQLLHELLVVGGTIYVHLDWRAASYARVVLDEIFGAASYRNEIVWKRHNARAAARDAWPRLHDDLLVYVKGRRGVFHPQRVPAPAARLPHTLVTGPDGKKYQTYELTAPGPTREGESGRPWRGFDPGRWGRHWSVGHEVLEALAAQGLIHWPARGGFPRRRAPEPFVPGERLVTVGDVWTDIDRINQAAGERWGYPTQKPERLLERIIAASSNPGDLVLDCFAGSGTTAVVAERLGRRWIVSDRGRLAVATTRRRLAALGSVHPFLVQDLGAGERRVWVASLDRAGDETAREVSHRRRVLERYGAQRIAGGAWLHGRKGGRWVHVGPADGPIGLDALTALAREAARVGAPEAEAATFATRASGFAATRPAVDVLGWEFDRTLDDAVAALAKELDVTLQLRLIPRELTSEDALDPVPIAAADFAPLRTLHAHVSVVGREATVELLGFELPAEGAPPRLGPAITHWSQWLDGWAVDWAHEGQMFRPSWQVFRTRSQGELPLRGTHRYDAPGRFRVAVRAFDLVGQETTVFLDAEVS